MYRLILLDLTVSIEPVPAAFGFSDQALVIRLQ